MSTQPVIAANAPTSAAPNELAMLMQGYSPQTAVAAQHSQYLAQALAAMSQQGQNIRTPVALGSNLLAEALLQRRYGQSMQALTQSVLAQQQAQHDAAFGGLTADDGAPAPGPSPGGPAPAAAVPAPPPAPTLQNTAPAPHPSIAQQGMDYFTGQGLTAPQAAGIIGNFGAESSLDPTRANQAEGAFGLGQWRGPRLAALQQFAQANRMDVNDPNTQFAFTMQELRGPEGAAYKRLVGATDPAAAADAFTAYERPAGYTPHGPASNVALIGQREAGARAAMPPAGMAPPSANPGISMPGQPGPAQIGNSGQNATTPSPSPASPGGTASAPPAAASPAAGGVSAPAAAGGLPPMPATLYAPVLRAEIARAQELYANSMTRNQGLALAQELQARKTTPIEPKVSDAPGGQMLYDPYGRYAPQYRQTPGLPMKREDLMTMGPNGQPQPITAPLSADKAFALQDQRLKSEGYQTWASSKEAFDAMKANAVQPGGMSGYALLDTFARTINPAGAVRLGTIKAIEEMQGLPEEIKGLLNNIGGQGKISPQLAQQIINAALPFVQANYARAQREQVQAIGLAKAQGIDPRAVTLDLGEAPTGLDINQAGGRPSIYNTNASPVPHPAQRPAPAPGGWSVMGVSH